MTVRMHTVAVAVAVVVAADVAVDVAATVAIVYHCCCCCHLSSTGPITSSISVKTRMMAST